MERKLLLDDLPADSLSIDEASNRLGVSTASVRNWIRTGYLTKTGRNLIGRASFEKFAGDVAGTEKLTKRANKSRLDSHDHEAWSRTILERLNSGPHADLALLGDDYSENLSNAYRNREGVYYTPPHIAASFFDALPGDRANLTFLDPCCGSGNFLVAAAEAGFRPRNIYGIEVDATAAAIARARLCNFESAAGANIVNGDFLEMLQDGQMPKPVDVIFTNPPWGKKISPNIKTPLCADFDVPRSIDSSALFFLACERLIADNSYLGMLLPDAFFSVAAFRKAREKALEHRIIQMADHGKVFRTLMTNVKSLTIRKQRCGREKVRCKVSGQTYRRSQDSFRLNPKSVFNIGCGPDEAEVISAILAMPHITLHGRADWGLGIVTGNNGRFVKRHPEPDHIPVFRGNDIDRDGLKDATCFIPRDLSLYQQVAPVKLFEAAEKLVYRFISSRLVFYFDTEQRYFLNSANMIVPYKDFPVRTGVLAQYLNTRFVNWLFGKLFATHKILRADLEQIPIFPQILQSHKQFDERRLLGSLGLIEAENGRSYRLEKQDP